MFVEKLEPDGASFSYSTYLPAYPTNVRPDGATSATGVAVDLAGHVYVTGHTMTTGFPTVNAVQASYAGNQDAFLTELDTTGQIVFSTYFGGSGEETDPSVAVDSTGNVLLTGRTTSLNFPTTENARQPLHAPDGGGYDAFVVRIVR